jgi:hypothetical protein
MWTPGARGLAFWRSNSMPKPDAVDDQRVRQMKLTSQPDFGAAARIPASPRSRRASRSAALLLNAKENASGLRARLGAGRYGRHCCRGSHPRADQ